MILLDTNVISEMMKQKPDGGVVAWIDKCDSSELYISVVTIAKISYGLHILPHGMRRSHLEQAFQKVILEAFENRILVFDEQAAFIYEIIMAERKFSGHLLGVSDGEIAAIARAHGAVLATRNIKDFLNCGLELLNPFDIGEKYLIP